MTPQGTLEFVRKHPRVNLELQAEFSVTTPGEANPKKESVLIKTLGGGGIMFVSPMSLQEGSIVDMKVYFEFSSIPFQAEVVWTELQVERKQKEFRCGLKFRSILDDDLLYIQYFLHKQLQTNRIPPHNLNPSWQPLFLLLFYAEAIYYLFESITLHHENILSTRRR